MNSKDKENLSYLYELDQFKSVVKLIKSAEKKAAKQLMNVDMSSLNAPTQAALIQGQALGVYSLLREIEKIHKALTKD